VTSRTPVALKRTSRSDSESAKTGLNGKWMSQAMTGTQRYAYEITRRLAIAELARYRLHVPRDADAIRL
jgi:hypothetical protein